MRLPQLVERRVGLRATVLRSVRRGLPHRVGRLLHLARGVSQILTLLFARELLEPARGFLHFFGKRTLPAAAAPDCCWPEAAIRRCRSASCC